MIRFSPNFSDDEELIEDTEIGLELIELVDDDAIVMMPDDGVSDKVEKSRSIVARIRLLIPKIQTLRKSPYSMEHFGHYRIIQENGEQIEVYLFPKSITGNTYETLEQKMRLIQQQTANMMLVNKRIIIGLLI